MRCTGTFIEGKCGCLPGWYGPKCGSQCKSSCGARGKCDDGPLGTGECLCDRCYEPDGRGGCRALPVPTCGKIGTPKCIANALKKTGNPLARDHYECDCPPTLDGLECENCLCKNRRACNPISHDCDCGNDFIGTFCEFNACTRKEVCNDRGECEARDKTTCICDKGWQGKNCGTVSANMMTELHFFCAPVLFETYNCRSAKKIYVTHVTTL